MKPGKGEGSMKKMNQIFLIVVGMGTMSLRGALPSLNTEVAVFEKEISELELELAAMNTLDTQKLDPVKPDPVKSDPVKSDPVKPNPVKPNPPTKPDPVRPDPVKPNPTKPDPVKPDPVKPDPVKPDSTKPNPVTKPDPVKPDPVKPDPVTKPDPVRPNRVKPDPTKPDPVKPDPVKPDPVKPDPVKPDPVKPDPVKPDPVKRDPVKPNPVKPDPVKPDPVKPNPVKPNPVKPNPPTKPDPVKPDPVKPNPTKPDPVRPDPVKPDPVKPNPTKPDPVKPDPVKPNPVKPDPTKPDPVKPNPPTKPNPVKPDLKKEELQKQMTALVVPYLDALTDLKVTPFGSKTAGKDSDLLASQEVVEYQTLLAMYQKKYYSKKSDATLQKYQFGSALLQIINVKNTFSSQLLNADMVMTTKQGETLSQNQVMALDPDAELKRIAASYEMAYTDFINFLQKNVTFNSVLAPLVMIGYQNFSLYAQAILNDTPLISISVVNPPVVKIVPAHVYNAKADAFIRDNFTDEAFKKNFNVTNYSIVKTVAQYKKLYSKTEENGAVYEMWAMYAPARYLELRYLAGFDVSLESSFIPAFNAYVSTYRTLLNKLPEPYRTECSELLQEFQLVADCLSIGNVLG